jgi:antitoxin component YwqK of YwqJK toxin-antitoxin module
MKRVFATLLLLGGTTFPLAAEGQGPPAPPAELKEAAASQRPVARAAATMGEPTPLAPEGGIPTLADEPGPGDHLPAPQNEPALPAPRSIPQGGSAPLTRSRKEPAPEGPLTPLPLEESVQPTSPPETSTQSAESSSETTETSTPSAKTIDVPTEVITERYPNRMIRIERHVTQDSDRNFTNHGPWIMYGPDGTLIAKGRFEFGKRHGEWQRLYDSKEERVVGKFGKQFTAPFIGIAYFVDGKLHGTWKIVDGQQRDVRSWEFKYGRPNGTTVTYFPNGRKHTEMTFVDGALNGPMIEWDSVGNVVKKTEYKDGRSTSPYVKKYPNGAKQHEGQYLGPKQMIKTEVDFWAGVVEPQVVKKEGKPKRHGKWTEFYEHGGKKFEGEFDEDQPIGLHTWWYSNGQKQAEGRFDHGKPHGHWVWWHENGLKQKDGAFQQGVQSGTWVHWKPDGKVQEVQEHSLAPISPQQAKPLATATEPAPQSHPTEFIDNDGTPTSVAPPAASAPPTRRMKPGPAPQRSQSSRFRSN